MEYMFLIYSNEEETAQLTPEQNREIMARHVAIRSDATARGVLRGAQRLESTSKAGTARNNGHHVLYTDGPFAETKEIMSGYYLIDCRDANEAREWAGRIAQTRKGLSVEYRPVFQAAAAGNA